MMYLAVHDLVGALDQRLGNQVDLALAAGGDFVEVGRRGDAALGHALGHLRAEVDQAVGRWAGEITQPGARACSRGWAIRPGRGSRRPSTEST